MPAPRFDGQPPELRSSLRSSEGSLRMLRGLVIFAVAAIAPWAVAEKGWQPPDDHVTLPLWPGRAPGAPTDLPPEADTTTPEQPLIAGRPIIRLGNVATPTLTVYPPAGRNSGAAVVVFPGGGYQILAIDLEGTEV